MDIKCLKCGNIVLAKRTTRKFCSQRCADAFRYIPSNRQPVYKNCGYCFKKIIVKKWKLKVFTTFYCSRECNIKKLKERAFRLNCSICGRVFYCQPCQVKYRNRQTCSIKCRSKLLQKRALENRIKNGFTKHQTDRCIRYSKEAKDWRKAVFERDDYTCQECGKKGVYLEADHIKPFAYFPELRFELSNGRTLCRKCHDKTKISAKKMKKLYENQMAETPKRV